MIGLLHLSCLHFPVSYGPYRKKQPQKLNPAQNSPVCGKFCLFMVFLALFSLTAESKNGYVIQIPPGQARPLLKGSLSEQNRLLDFKMVKAPWLSKYPVLHKKVSQLIQTKKKAILEDARSLSKAFPKSALLPYRLYVEEIKHFSPKDPDIVSLRIKLYTYTGGAHGGTQYHSWNYNIKSQKFLSLSDLFPISDYCAQLVMVGRKPFFQKKPLKACQHPANQIKTNINQTGFEKGASLGVFSSYNKDMKPENSNKIGIIGSESLLNTIIQAQDILFAFRKQGNEYDRHIKGDILRGTIKAKHFKIWNVHEDKIVFLFPEYQVGPYSAGSFEVFIPLRS